MMILKKLSIQIYLKWNTVGLVKESLWNVHFYQNIMQGLFRKSLIDGEVHKQSKKFKVRILKSSEDSF